MQILFLYFGFRLLKDAYDMDGSGPSDELQEVEEELRKTKGDGKGEEADDRRSSGDHDEEEGKLLSSSGGGNHHEKVKLAAVAAEKLKVFTQVR